MFGTWNFSLFFMAALVIAATPGPGIFYVAARTLSGGRVEGIASSLGTAVGGLVHVSAGAFGVSAIILASAQLFTALKLVGAAYLLWLGIKTIREAYVTLLGPVESTGAKRAFRQGIVVEALNPKTAAFFLAFIPQFIEPDAAHVALQFVVLGLISVTLNTAADIVVVLLASAARAGLSRKPHFIRRLRQGAGLIISGLGLSLALTSRPGPH
jgi:threonine/homoserine/homoserine lactone efflux protein